MNSLQRLFGKPKVEAAQEQQSNSRNYFPDGTWVKAKRSGGIRYVTRQTNKDCFEDDGKISGLAPSPYCHYDNYELHHPTLSQSIVEPDVVPSVSVSCWIVRNSAFSIQCGGLERLFIHFSKPIYMLALLSDKDRDTPFGDISVQEGMYKKYGWQSTQKTWVNSQSVGNWIGYDNEVSNFIWDELCKHFHNEPFGKWDEVEKSGRSKIEDFCLELKLLLSIS